MKSQRGVANGQREMIDNGYQAWGNGPAVYNDLYFHEHIYASHFQGPRFYHSGQDEHMYPYLLSSLPMSILVLAIKSSFLVRRTSKVIRIPSPVAIAIFGTLL